MNIPRLALSCLLLAVFSMQHAAADDYPSQLFKSIKLIYEQDFEKEGPLKESNHWVIRQNTRWSVKDGVLTGRVADEKFQQMMQAKNDGHDGTRPVIFLRPVPEAFVVRMRVRYNETGKKGRDRGSLLDLGHHVNSFIFGETQTKLTLQKEKKIFIEGDFFPLKPNDESHNATVRSNTGSLIVGF